MDAMMIALRNLAIAVVFSVIALLLGAASQELIVRLLPMSRNIFVGAIDVGSWVGFIAVFLSFAITSALQIRWLRSKMSLPWILLGPFLFLIAASLQGFGLSGCLRQWMGSAQPFSINCGMVTAILLSPMSGAFAGFLCQRLWQHLMTNAGDGAKT